MMRGECYPSWRYHATEAPRLCKDAAEDSDLGAEWADTPEAFTAAAEPEAEEDPVEASDDAAPRKRGRPRKVE